MIVNQQIQKIDIRSTDYPEKLREIPDPPGQLYCMGDISLLKEKSIGIVGSRKNTIYGRNVALMIGRRLAESGIAVTSGLALGIDGYSHEGALEADGKVIGVLGSGLHNMGPKKNLPLMNRGLEKGGLMLSEYAPEEHASRITFPARNRIISGVSDAVVVVEAGLESGSLITARHASEQGKTVYAVPGNINSSASIGCNLLIRDGAVPLIVIDDLIRDIGGSPARAYRFDAELENDEKRIFEVISSMNGATSDEITERTGFSPQIVNSILTVMEIKGVVEPYAGRIYVSH